MRRAKPKKGMKTRMPWRSKCCFLRFVRLLARTHRPRSECSKPHGGRQAFPLQQIISIDSPLVHYTTSTRVKSVVRYHQGWYEPEGFISDSSN